MICLCVAGGLMGRVQTRERNEGKVGPISGIVRAAISPWAGSLTSMLNGVEHFSLGIFSASDLSRQNEMLRRRAQAAAMYQDHLSRLQRELDSVRRLQGLPDLPGRTAVAADVIGFFFRDNRLTLNAGKNKGIERGMPVRNADGLVGVVQTVADTECQVMLITSTSLNNGNGIGAMDISRNPPAFGLLIGQTPSTLKIEFQDPKAPVLTGDVIATSGLSDKTPRGIPIGRVILVEDDPEFGIRRAIVDPFISVATLREVQVLK